MAKGKYNRDYRLIEEFRENGRVRTGYEYIGDPWFFRLDEKTVAAEKKKAAAKKNTTPRKRTMTTVLMSSMRKKNRNCPQMNMMKRSATAFSLREEPEIFSGSYSARS